MGRVEHVPSTVYVMAIWWHSSTHGYSLTRSCDYSPPHSNNTFVCATSQCSNYYVMIILVSPPLSLSLSLSTSLSLPPPAPSLPSPSVCVYVSMFCCIQAHQYLREEVREFLGHPIRARIKGTTVQRSSGMPKKTRNVSYPIPQPVYNGSPQVRVCVCVSERRERERERERERKGERTCVPVPVHVGDQCVCVCVCVCVCIGGCMCSVFNFPFVAQYLIYAFSSFAIYEWRVAVANLLPCTTMNEIIVFPPAWLR